MAVYIDSIDEKTAREWNEILTLKVEDEAPSEWGDMDRVTRMTDTKIGSDMSTTSRNLIELALPFFQKAGLVVCPHRGYINYVSHFYDIKTVSVCDEYSATNEAYSRGRVHTCLIILQKDERLKGGDLHVYEDNPRDFLKLIGYEKASRRELETVPGMVVALDGDVIYELTRCANRGYLNYVEVTLYTDDGEA